MLNLVMLLLAAIAIALAKHGRGRRRRNFDGYFKGQLNFKMPFGALAGRTVISQANSDLVNEQTRISSIKCIYTLGNFSNATDRGPMYFGVAHSDYTSAEIEEWIEAAASWDQGDLLAQREVGKRLIRRIGTFPSGDDVNAHMVFNDGRPMTTKLNWQVVTNQGLKFWAYNAGSAALANGDLNVEGHANCWRA